MAQQCKKCEGPMFKSVALKDDIAEMGIPDFPGSDVISRGQTVTLKSDGKLHDCMKCSWCGWSAQLTGKEASDEN